MSRKTTWALAACRRRRDNAIVEHNAKLSRLKHFISRCVMCIANQRCQSMLRVSHCVSGELILVGTPFELSLRGASVLDPAFREATANCTALSSLATSRTRHTLLRGALACLSTPSSFFAIRANLIKKPRGATCVPVPALASGLEVSESTKETLDLRPQGALFEQGER
jgi:hypothetical protein